MCRFIFSGFLTIKCRLLHEAAAFVHRPVIDSSYKEIGKGMRPCNYTKRSDERAYAFFQTLVPSTCRLIATTGSQRVYMRGVSLGSSMLPTTCISGFGAYSNGVIDRYLARPYLELEETLHAVAIEPTRHAVLQTLPHNNRRL